MYEKYKLDFAGTFFLLASNKLPQWSEFRNENDLERGDSNYDYINYWKPLETRCGFVTLEESFIGGDFPYDAPILAGGILELLRKSGHQVQIPTR